MCTELALDEIPDIYKLIMGRAIEGTAFEIIAPLRLTMGRWVGSMYKRSPKNRTGVR